MKPIVEFFNDRYAKDGHSYSCKVCDLSRKRKFHQKNSEKHLRAVRKSNYQRNYGISINDYDRLFESQDGKCAICGTVRPGKTAKNFAIDHDHGTGQIRGLLCETCNRGLGLFRDDSNLLEKAILYLSTN